MVETVVSKALYLFAQLTGRERWQISVAELVHLNVRLDIAGDWVKSAANVGRWLGAGPLVVMMVYGPCITDTADMLFSDNQAVESVLVKGYSYLA